MRTLKWPVTAIIVIVALLLVSAWKLSQPIFHEDLDEQTLLSGIRIATPEQALTFARLQTGEVLLVLAADDAGVSAVDVAAVSGLSFDDSIDAYHQLGGNTLQAMAHDRQQSRSYPWNSLGLPVDGSYPHIAAGTNYRAHAEEVGHAGEPFVFPKFSKLTKWNADVVDGARLDYEVELCAVLLSDHAPQRSAQLGYVLCGDFTDRWLLIKEMDLGGPMGPTGFPAGKGGDTRLPVGNLLVIPAASDFYRKIELKLYLNGQLRQRDSAGLMIWSPQQALNKVLADCRVPYFRNGGETALTPSCEKVPAGTLLLTGTPEGVIFNLATLWSPFAYLRPGDEVISVGTYLGFMRNKISRGSK